MARWATSPSDAGSGSSIPRRPPARVGGTPVRAAARPHRGEADAVGRPGRRGPWAVPAGLHGHARSGRRAGATGVVAVGGGQPGEVKVG